MLPCTKCICQRYIGFMIDRPPQPWIIVADCHEPLVTKELFARAQERLGGEQRQFSTHNKWKTPLSKKVYCGVCGYAIIRRGTQNRYYCCQMSRTVPWMECYPEKIFESETLDTATVAIRQQARCVVDTQHMMEQQKKAQEAAVTLLRKKAKEALNKSAIGKDGQSTGKGGRNCKVQMGGNRNIYGT